jgi:hypothetical protein
LNFALNNALQSFGMPCGLTRSNAKLALSAEAAAVGLDRAFRQLYVSRIHLCPLDCADTLPALNFGSSCIRQFSQSELDELLDPLRLKRRSPNYTFDSQRFSSFTWLVVTEHIQLDHSAGERAAPFLFESINDEFGSIEPHKQSMSAAVHSSLFALLLAPWEDWAQFTSIDWRGFYVPWTYTFEDDVFAQFSLPPSADSLSWEYRVGTTHDGEESVYEHPVCLPLKNSVTSASTWINDEAWSKLSEAQQSPIFGSVISHFLVRAFLSTGIDEFLAHITVIEAALGMRDDYSAGNRRKNRGGATGRVAARLSALLGDKAYGTDYFRLFDTRSEFLHGRSMPAICSPDRILVRIIARQTVVALISAALLDPLQPRDVFLQRLLDAGLAM